MSKTKPKEFVLFIETDHSAYQSHSGFIKVLDEFIRCENGVLKDKHSRYIISKKFDNAVFVKTNTRYLVISRIKELAKRYNLQVILVKDGRLSYKVMAEAKLLSALTELN